MISHNNFRNDVPIVELSHVVEFLDNKRKPITEKDRIAGPYPYYGANGVQDYVADWIFDEELILVAEDGGHFEDPDRGVAYKISGKTWVNNHAHVLRPKKIDVDYLLHVLKNMDLMPYVNGATRLKLTKSNAEKIKIPLPSLSEQKRIATILDKAYEIKAKHEQAVTKLNELSASAFNECFLKSTNQTVAKIKSLVVKRRLSETNDTKVWSLALDQIESNSSEVLSRVIVNRAKLGTSTYYFEPDVVLYSKLRPYLNKVVTPDTYGYATTELVPLYCNKEIILPSFMAAYLRSPRFVDFANTNSAGAKMPRVIMDKFWDYEMLVPNLEVQNAFQKLHEKCIAIKMQLKRSIEKQDSLIQSLQYQAFTTGF